MAKKNEPVVSHDPPPDVPPDVKSGKKGKK